MPTATERSVGWLTTLERCETDSVIGGGGNGAIYRIVDNDHGESFAMKILKQKAPADDENCARRFFREARAMAKISHPGVARLVETGHTEDGSPYLVMPLLEGTSLERVVDDGVLPIEEAVHIVRTIALALADVHAAGVVHRDLSPGNIMMVDVEDGIQPTIIDFGNAWVDDDDMVDVPNGPPGIVVGTPFYMSPEQIRDDYVDHRTDIYSLGVILFELLDGTPPFDDYSAMKILRQHLEDDPPELDSPYGAVPVNLEYIVRRCLEKAPVDRYQSAGELVADLDRVIANQLACDSLM